MVIRICCLIPENQRQRTSTCEMCWKIFEAFESIFLEHEEEKKYLFASADFMTKYTEEKSGGGNSIYDPDIKMQLIEMFITMLSDNQKAREEDNKGNYKIPKNQDTPLNSQEFFYEQAYEVLRYENAKILKDA